jgi:hypothetical protein
MEKVEERLSIVESALAEFIIQSNRSLHRLEREMVAFKDEMKDFKDEMKDFKDEMKGFKDGVEDFKDEMREDRREMNRQWGALANKMGTIVEDIVAPAVKPVVEKYFGEQVLDLMINRKKYDKRAGVQGEFDVIAVTGDSVFLVQTKVSPDKEKLLEFKNKQLPRFRQLFPEYKKLKLVPILAALRFDEKMIRFANQEKIYLLAYREWDYMDILNFDAVSGQ